MHSHFFTLFFRRQANNPGFSAISYINLVAGFTAFALLGLYLQFNLNFDRHNLNFDRIYRVQMFMDVPMMEMKHTTSVTAALGRHDLPKLSEVEETAVIHSAGDENIDGFYFVPENNKPVYLKNGFYSDPSIFRIFTFQFLEGSAEQALSEPFTLVLSEDAAAKFFRPGEAYGKTLMLENKIPLKVSGVYKNLPMNSDWRPEFLIPMESLRPITGWEDFENNYWMYSFQVYVLLYKNADYLSVNNKIHGALKNYREHHHPYLRPLSALHLNALFQPDMIIAVSLFAFIAILILVLTSLNFVNLQTAEASTRSKETGIKKSLGYTKREIWFQYVGESLIISLSSAIIALMFTHYCIPAFHTLIGADLGLNIYNNLQMIGLVVGAAILAGFVSSLWPAYIISRYNPVNALKQTVNDESGKGLKLRKVLVSTQFAISLFLVIVGFIILKQANFMLNRDPGFNKENLLVTNIKTFKTGSFEPVRQQLLENPLIVNACFSDYIPYILSGGDEMSWEGAAPEDRIFVRINNVSRDFFDTWEMKIVQGRGFDREFGADADKCLVNEAAVRHFGWTNPIGMRVKTTFKGDWQVIGVVGDYVAQSVHNEIEPHVYRLMPDSASLTGMYTIRIQKDRKEEALRYINEIMMAGYPTDTFEFEPFTNLISMENATRIWQVFKNISLLFAFISILISSIGLFGLVIYYSRNKMKEIGIRKAVGFTVKELYLKMSFEFMGTIAWGTVFSWAGAWYVYKMLPGAYKYGLGYTEFLTGTLVIFSVAFLTISFTLLQAARKNPASILKYE